MNLINISAFIAGKMYYIAVITSECWKQDKYWDNSESDLV